MLKPRDTSLKPRGSSLNHSLARALLLLAVIAVVQMVLQLPSLPSPLAVQFSSAGAVTRWGSPHEFVILNLCIVAALIAITLFLPAFLGKRPRMRWRLPNRDYWLAPERIAGTIDYIKRQLLWYGVMTMLLLMAAFQLVVDANARVPPRIDSTRLMILIGLFIVSMLLWAWAFWRKFSRIPADRADNPFG